MSKFPHLTASRLMTLCWLVAAVVALTLGPRAAQAAEMRFALVVGNDEYKSAKLATPANDAGLVADALTAAGFAVTGARNLDQATLRESFREFIGQAAAAGPDAIVVVYLAGYGVQFAGENYFVPVDADLARDVDVPLQAVRVSDFAQPLAALPGRVKLVIVDAARQNTLPQGGEPLASGLALVDPVAGMAIAFNAAPGTVGPDEQGPYGAYATALAEMIAAGGLTLDDVFTRVRLRVSEVTGGAEVPWYASRIDGPFFFTERTADAPPPPDVVPLADLRDQPMRGYSSVEDAYAAALALDTMAGYEQFLALYPSSPFSPRVAAMLAVRREQIIWRRCAFDNTPPAFWSYLRRYPRGPHAWDARRRLGMLGAPFDGPADFALVDFDVPPPPPNEMVFVDRPVVMFWGPGYEPPPRPPVRFLPPRPREFAALPPPPPPPPHERFFLPAPAAAVVPVFVKPPRTVAVRPVPPAAVPGHAAVALPGVVQRAGPSHPEGVSPPAPPSTASIKPAPLPQPPLAPSAAPATIKPAPSPPPPSGLAPATIKPAPMPAPPSVATPAMIKPAPAPLPPPGLAPATIKPAPMPAPPSVAAPAMIKPAPAPPPPPPHPPAAATIKPAAPPPAPPPAAPATVKPAAPLPPPPHPAGSAPTAAKPACPPGKAFAEVNGHPTCK
jgi:uncharacterized caspase-like protein